VVLPFAWRFSGGGRDAIAVAGRGGTLLPGRSIIRTERAGLGSAIGNVLWFVLAGIWLAIGHALSGVVLCVTIIGIPLGIANFKMIPVSLTPLGRTNVRSDDLRAVYRQGVT
jgi:uncharacterized membrane protein YccF (DUF307 family)